MERSACRDSPFVVDNSDMRSRCAVVVLAGCSSSVVGVLHDGDRSGVLDTFHRVDDGRDRDGVDVAVAVR